ncbi:putative quinol monooxygenase [Acanthopleuribacter pedis]|uniref:Antibiotic biosynthesis monooxygenase n=1 Tax=Acanthopleuribacter pedis TaxID=442870 RepID=A0A8J7QJM4_9BACT|nr:antibiotic biosynthesis monooxygenase [Acanthopleuribacter pedis]MBO1319433.1 antibiotic biosynthesis monooxygenase [Acanthopleuribacter pedis]
MIHVIARLQTEPGQRDTVYNAFKETLAVVQAKPGCIEYVPAVHFDSGMPGQVGHADDEVLIVEKWTDLAALQAHIQDPAYREWYLGVWPNIASASMEIYESEG